MHRYGHPHSEICMITDCEDSWSSDLQVLGKRRFVMACTNSSEPWEEKRGEGDCAQASPQYLIFGGGIRSNVEANLFRSPRTSSLDVPYSGYDTPIVAHLFLSDTLRISSHYRK